MVEHSESVENMILPNRCTTKHGTWRSGMTFTAGLRSLASLASKLLARLSTGVCVERRLALDAICEVSLESPLEDFPNATDRSVVPDGPWFVRWPVGAVRWLAPRSTHLRRNLWLCHNPRG